MDNTPLATDVAAPIEPAGPITGANGGTTSPAPSFPTSSTTISPTTSAICLPTSSTFSSPGPISDSSTTLGPPAAPADHTSTTPVVRPSQQRFCCLRSGCQWICADRCIKPNRGQLYIIARLLPICRQQVPLLHTQVAKELESIQQA